MQFGEIIELGNSTRTEDVRSTIDFKELMISGSVVTRMTHNGFKYPSPVQANAIPAALSGQDLLVQAKSGTGKTLVFSIMAVENLNTRLNFPQRLLVAPTREIAIQIKDTIKKLQPPGCRTTVLVGGQPLSLDRQALRKGSHIVVGTTGRICQLIQEGDLKLNHVELFVLDEADKLMDIDFQKDINFIFSNLPPSRQVGVFSATYPRNLDETLGKYMRNACLIQLNADDVQLVGIKQYMSIVFNSSAIASAIDIFNNVCFTQALVFCNTYLECEPICSQLIEAGFNAAFISSKMTQPEREKVIERLKTNNLKILVSTDLTARGIDASNVNMVINIGAAIDAETYFHRIGRAARFGGQGASVTLLEDGRSVAAFNAIVSSGGIKVKVLDLKRLPQDLPSNVGHFESCVDFSSSKKVAKPIAKVKPVTNIPQTSDVKIFDGFVCLKDVECIYDREQMYELQETNLPLSAEFEQRIRDLEVGRTTFMDEVDDLAAQMKAAKDLAPPREENRPEEKKFKFVPSREKAKKKFYMRGELLAVRDAFPESHWLEYAQKKYDFSEDPFLLPEKRSQVTLDQLLDGMLPNGPESSATIEIDGVSDSPKTSVEEPDIEEEGLDIPLRIPEHAYTKEEMIGIQQSWPRETWLQYVKSKWDVKEDPFVIDSQMRCSITEQIRRQREKEKLERIKVMREREAAAKSNELVSSSRSINVPTTAAESWDDFCSDLWNKFEEFRATPPDNKGSVVPLRDSPAIWRERVDFYSSMVNNMEAIFERDTKMSAGFVQDTAVDTEFNYLEEALQKLKLEAEEVASNYETAAEEMEPKETVTACRERDSSEEELVQDIEDPAVDDVNEHVEKIPAQLPAMESKEDESMAYVDPTPFAEVYNRYFSLMRAYCHN